MNGSLRVKLSKKVHVKAIYIYTSERSCYAPSKNVIVYHAMTYCFEDISVWNRRTLLNSCWVNIVFDNLIADISWMVAQTPINHIIFWKTVIRTFRFIYVNCFNRLRFLAKVSTTLKKIHFFGQFKDHNSGRRCGS